LTRWMEALHVPPALRLPVRAPQKHAICVALGRHELRARVQAPGRPLWVRLPHGRGRGQGLLGCDPERESNRKIQVRHLGAGMRSEPPSEVKWT